MQYKLLGYSQPVNMILVFLEPNCEAVVECEWTMCHSIVPVIVCVRTCGAQ